MKKAKKPHILLKNSSFLSHISNYKNLMQFLIKKGKKFTLENIFRNSLIFNKKLISKTNVDVVFKKAFKNTTPKVNLRTKRKGSKNVLIPFFLRKRKGRFYSAKWILENAFAKKKRNFCEGIFEELIDSSVKKSLSVKKREELHKLAEDNLYLVKKRTKRNLWKFRKTWWPQTALKRKKIVSKNGKIFSEIFKTQENLNTLIKFYLQKNREEHILFLQMQNRIDFLKRFNIKFWYKQKDLQKKVKQTFLRNMRRSFLKRFKNNILEFQLRKRLYVEGVTKLIAQRFVHHAFSRYAAIKKRREFAYEKHLNSVQKKSSKKKIFQKNLTTVAKPLVNQQFKSKTFTELKKTNKKKIPTIIK